MKTICRILLATLITLKCLTAQYETTFVLYDTIAEGPYISQEKDGYNFLFKTKEEGTMVSTRGQVVNPSLDYYIFNHYYLNGDGSIDSLLSIPIREDVTHHYTMYKRGLPKLIQYRVGTSNDPTLEKITSKYPIIKSERNNDELHSISEITIEDAKYSLTRKSYNKGTYRETAKKSLIELEAEEGTWILKHTYSAENIDLPLSLLAYGKKIEDDKTRKYNDMMEFRFIVLDAAGQIARDEEMTFDKAYEFQTSGLIHNTEGAVSGFFMSMVEASGRANKEYNASSQKVLFFDEKGYYDSETEIILPYEPKSKEVAEQRITKVLQTESGNMVYLTTPGIKKEKIQRGVFSFKVNEESSELLSFKGLEEIKVDQDQRNFFEDGPPTSSDYKYGLRLGNGHFLAIASDNGVNLEFMQFDKDGAIVKRSTAYMLTDIASQKNVLNFEYLNNNKILISSKVGYEKGVYTSYGIYDARSGLFTTIQPTEDIATINSYRNGDDIMVFGSSWEDDKVIHLILHKLDTKVEGLSSLDQD